MKTSVLLILFISFINIPSYAGKKLKVLFIGNSYTYLYDIPKLTADVALSTGDTLIYDMSASGGQTIQGHLIDAQTQSKIKAGGWDYVIVQEQSQVPSFPDGQIQTGFLPLARKLDSIIHVHNPCSQTMFYMTWGRKNGDDLNCPVYPPVCTYEGMDSLLRLRYMMVADSNNAEVAPVGAVRHYIRSKHPAIELYEPDESHQSQSGAYVSACTFYTMLFRKDPLSITHNYTLSATDALNIRQATKKVTFDSLSYWHAGEYDMTPGFSLTINSLAVTLTNQSVNAVDYLWNFGDGQTSTQASPAHTYSAEGIYKISLTAGNDNGCAKTLDTTINLYPTAIGFQKIRNALNIYPNPVTYNLNIVMDDLEEGEYRLKIINQLGQEVYNIPSLQGQTNSINTSELPAGHYTLVISNSRHIYQKHFVKQ